MDIADGETHLREVECSQVSDHDSQVNSVNSRHFTQINSEHMLVGTSIDMLERRH